MRWFRLEAVWCLISLTRQLECVSYDYNVYVADRCQLISSNTHTRGLQRLEIRSRF